MSFLDVHERAARPLVQKLRPWLIAVRVLLTKEFKGSHNVSGDVSSKASVNVVDWDEAECFDDFSDFVIVFDSLYLLSEKKMDPFWMAGAWSFQVSEIS